LFQDTSLGKLIVNPKLVEKIDLKRDMALTGNKIDSETTKMKELEQYAKMGFGIDIINSKEEDKFF
jgi:hypothetical protein